MNLLHKFNILYGNEDCLILFGRFDQTGVNSVTDRKVGFCAFIRKQI